jgi:hypothetical protein
MGQISVKTYAPKGSDLGDNQQRSPPGTRAINLKSFTRPPLAQVSMGSDRCDLCCLRTGLGLGH